MLTLERLLFVRTFLGITMIPMSVQPEHRKALSNYIAQKGQDWARCFMFVQNYFLNLKHKKDLF